MHDLAYWVGGSEVDKYHADGRFYNCLLLNSTASIAEVFSTSVAMFGDPYWGRDWINRPTFQALSEEEKAIVLRQFPKNPFTTLCEDGEVRASHVPVGF